jgi:hypothetical protein
MVVGAFGMFACGSEEPQEEASAAWTVEETPNPVKSPGVPSDLPAVVVADSLPSNFPVDVPQYPGAKVKASRSAAGLPGMSVSFIAEDSVEKVIAFYSDTFAAQGWATDMRRTPEGTAVFAEKDKRSASALVRDGGEGTRIDVIVVDR